MFGLEVISKVTRAILDAGQGKLTPEQAIAQIQEATRQDGAVDAKANAALDKKFSP